MIFNKKTQENAKEKTIGDVFGSKHEGRVIIDYTRLQKSIRECKDKENDNVCRRELKDLGIEWID
jgi:hypothetical protein